jgi:predicted DNA-binding transcriptional regulator AlpA
MDAQREDWELWTWREVSRALKASRSWVYAAAERGELPSLRVAGLLRFDPIAIRHFVVAQAHGVRVLALDKRPGLAKDGQ